MYQVSPMNWILIFFFVLYFLFNLFFSNLYSEKSLFSYKTMKKIYVK